MPTHSSTHEDLTTGSTARLLFGLMSALLALLILNLAVFDDLRIDPAAGALETFTEPQHLSNLLSVVAAGVLIALRHRLAARVAVIVAWTEIAAFLFFHAIPVEIGPSEPFWGEGMADALQWFGLIAILGVSVAIIRAAPRPPQTAVLS